MKLKTKDLWLIVFILLYPLTSPLVKHIPNPMLPGASIALNMVWIVLAGYLFGPLSGALAGALGTFLAALVFADVYDGLAVFPHLLMGLTAGYLGSQPNRELPAAATILIGHLLNLLIFLRIPATTPTTDPALLALGIAAEAMIDVVTLMFFIPLLQKWLYHKTRW